MAPSTPAFDGVIVERCTRVLRAACHGGGRSASSEVDGLKRLHFAFFVSQSRPAVVSQLAFAILSPAFEGAIIKDNARVEKKCRKE